MDFEDDVVETSDVEELEELRTSRLESSPVAAVRKFGTRSATEDLSPPRKKMKLAHNASVEDQKSSPSPAKYILTDCNTPHRSQSSSLTLPTTSPGQPQYSSSRTQTPDIIYNTPCRKLEEDLQIIALFTSPQSRSQGPQLLVSPSVPQPVFNSSIPEKNDFNSYTPLEYPNSPIMPTTTPTSSPPGPRYRSQSADPFSSISISPPSRSLARPSEEDVNHDDLDDLLSFSPAKPTSSQVPASPLSPKTTDPEPSSRSYSKEVSPEARQSLSPSQASNRGLLPEPGPSQSRPTVGLAPVPDTDNDAALAQILDEQRPRYPYPLRTRRPAQMNPYTAEALVYKQTLKNNPEAVVKFKNMDHRRRHPDDRYEHEETQQDGYTYEGDEDQEDDADWNERERRRLQRHEQQLRRLEIAKNSEARDASSEREPIQYPGILQDDLSSEDEEEKRQMNALSKEGLKLLRQERKRRKAEEKERRRLEEESRKAKRFPVPKGISVAPRASSSELRVSASPRRSNGGSDDHVDFVSSNSGSDPFRRRRDIEGPAHGESTQSDQPDFIADYFAEGEGFPTFNEDYPMDDIEGPIPSQHSPPPSSTILLRNSYDGAINVDSDQDEEMSSESEILHQSSHSQSSTTKIGGIEIDLPANKTKLLSRMMPKVMIASLAKKEAEAAAAAKRKKRRTLQEDVVHSGPLLPGQTRVQTAVNPKDVRDIKGDSESELEIPEDSDSSSSSYDDVMTSHRGRENVADDSGSDEDDIIKAYRPPSPRKSQKPKALDFDDFDGFNSGSDGDVQIVSSNIRKKGAMGRLRDPSVIDYMLARPRTLWGSRSSSVRSGGGSNHRASSGYKIDVVTSGAKGFGRGRQALLSFDGHQQIKKPGSRPKSEASAKVSKPKHINSLHDGDRMPSDDVQVVRKSKRMSLKELKKLRRKAEKARGVWTMRSNGDRITTGKDTAWITVDIGDEYFHRALEPLSSPGPSHTSVRPKEPSSSRVSTKPTAMQQSSDPGSIDINVENMKRPICIPSDFKLSPLHSGMSFGGSTYIRKGLLHELLKVAYSSQEPSLPNYPMTLFGFELGPTTSLEETSSKISGIFDALFEFATGLPDPDSDLLASQWSTVTRVVCQLVSWHLKNAQEPEAAALRNVIWKEIIRLVAQVYECSLDFVEGPVLVVCWFFVELSARSAPPTPVVGCPPGPFKDSVQLLMQLLLQFGLRKTMKALEPEPGVETELLDGSSPAHLAAELWVRLIHVLGGCAATQEPKYKTHPFWQALIDVLPSHIQACKSKSMKHFEISDDIWRTIFSICNLSQFSAHGMTMNQSHLTACWDVVAFALKAINLKHSPEDHDHLPLVSLMKRDNCVALAAIRCFHLRDKWQWRLDGASVMFNQLAEIFRSRKFRNLLHEDKEYADYPKFFRDKDWDLLSSYDPKDSAFAIFLKLIYQAVKEDPQYAQGNLSPKVRKLLSMAVPTGTLSFSKTNPPGERDLTMLYNRMAALAIVTDLDRSDCDTMISKGRGYISFVNADDHSRIAVIRALTDWAQLLVSRSIAIKEMGVWIEEIATVIEAEVKAFATPEPASASFAEQPTSRARQRLMDFSNVILGAVRQIIESYARCARYPEPFLLLRLRPLTSTSTWIFQNNAVKTEVSLLANAVFDARAAALRPPPPLPPPTEEDSQESQDFGEMALNMDGDVDWSMVDASLALLAPSNANSTPGPTNRSLNDSELRKALSTSRLDQRIYDFTVKAVQPPGLIGDALKNYTRECDNWLRLWLSCGSLEVQTNMWDSYLGRLKGMLSDCKDERWARRVRLSVMLQILKLDPMSYSTLTGPAFEAFLSALVSDNNKDENGQPKHCKIEREYAAMMLSIGGLRHPLLLNAPCLPKPIQDTEDYKFLPEEFLELRLPLLQVIFKNLNESISKQLADNVGVDSTNLEYVRMCCAMFSGMRYCLGKSDKAPEGVSMYNDFCFQVVDALKQNPDLCKHSRMTFWVHTWPKCLLPPRAGS